ncbi:MAG: hypothetical protein OEW81_10590 [Gammaproteobacteria bacterium]|nr:hypothetical protein [Gammaproteobacteria bacterium]
MRKPILSALLLLTTISGWVIAAADELLVVVEPSVAEIEPRPPGPRVVRLPDMAFTMHIAAQCGAGMQAESASISISDTRHSLGPEALADSAATELVIRIPRQQLAPLTIDNFCLIDTSADDARHLNIADALSAQVSLRCAGENQHSIIYRATPLAIRLRCKTGDDN